MVDSIGDTSNSIVNGMSISTFGRGGGGGAVTTAAVGTLRGRAAISPLVAAVVPRRRPGRATLRPMILSSCWINHGRRSDPPGKTLTADHRLFKPLLSNNALAAARLPSWLSVSAC